jgi:general secretion pathway protein D
MSLRMTLMTAIALTCALPALVAAGPGGKRGESACKDTQITRVVYPVADLVIPILDYCAVEKDAATLEGRLMELIKGTVQPKSWKEQGGAGTLQYYPMGMSLVVEQSAEVQGEVNDLLRALRRLQDVEVAVETRIVQISPELAARFRDKVGFAPVRAENGETFVPLGTAFGLKSAGKMETGGSGQDTAVFTDKELYPWLKLFQNERATNLMQTPKTTMFNGQRALVTVSTQQSFLTEYKIARDKDKLTVVPQHEVVDVGLKSIMLPTVSADLRSVRLAVDFRSTALLGAAAEVPVAIKVGAGKEFRGTVQIPQVETLTCKQTCVIPDGQTMAVSLGQVMVDARTEFPTEFVSRIPYLSRLLRNVGYSREAREVFLFITPRVIINEEEEQIFLGHTPPIPRP